MQSSETDVDDEIAFEMDIFLKKTFLMLLLLFVVYMDNIFKDSPSISVRVYRGYLEYFQCDLSTSFLLDVS